MTDDPNLYMWRLDGVGSVLMRRTVRVSKGSRRRVYAYILSDESDRRLHESISYYGPMDGSSPEPRLMVAELLSTLVLDAMAPLLDDNPNAAIFPAHVRVWAQEHAEALSAATLRIEKEEA